MRKWRLGIHEIDEWLLRKILKRLCDMAVIPDDYDEDLIFDTFADGEFVKEM